MLRKHPLHALRVRDGDAPSTLLFGERYVTLYLAYVDYLSVTYKRKFFGRNLIRSKTPPSTERRTALHNVLDMGGFPFASYRVLEAESVGTVTKKCEVVDATEIGRAKIVAPPPADAKVRKTVEKHVASFYRLSNAAFPLSREMARKRDWTEEDLRELLPGPDYRKVRRDF